jgi:PAS domain S-box-containing protein
MPDADDPVAQAAQLADVLESISDAFYAVDRDWCFTYINREAERVWQRQRAGLLGRPLLECFPQAAGSEAHGILAAAMQRRCTMRGEVRSPVVGEWLDVHAHPKEDGGISVYFSVITERIRAADRLREREAELARVQRIGGIAGVEVLVSEGFRSRRSPEYLRLHGLPDDAIEEPHEGWLSRLHPDDRAEAERALHQAVAGGAAEYQAEYRIIRPSDGALRWISAKAEIERDAAGRAIRLFGAHIDITDRKHAEAERESLLAALSAERALQTLLIHELNHRVKNTLATVQSIVRQTLRNAPDLGAARHMVDVRLVALARAHDVLTREAWRDADLGEIVAQAVAGNAADGRIEVSGPSLRLSPRQSLAIAMALHELLTNARKHGALSGPQGRVRLDWSATGHGDRGALHMVWQERDGPPVQAPQRQGFGTRLIQQGLAGELDGAVTLDFLPDGVRCTIDAPIASGNRNQLR